MFNTQPRQNGSSEVSSDDSYKKALRRRERQRLFKEMAMQNVMIESIKDKLRAKQLDISPTSLSPYSYGRLLEDIPSKSV